MHSALNAYALFDFNIGARTTLSSAWIHDGARLTSPALEDEPQASPREQDPPLEPAAPEQGAHYPTEG
jgi:hypothetical protein